VAACALSALTACSKSSSNGHSTSRPSTTASTSSPPPSAAELKKIVLQPADLPAGWKGTPYKPSADDAANQAALVKCVGGRNTDPDKVAESHSQDFEQGNSTISSAASSYRSQSDLDADVALVHSPKISGCYEQLVKDSVGPTMPTGTKISSVSMKITPGSGGGPANVVATGTGKIRVEASGQRVTVYINVAFITGRLVEAEVDSEGIGAPIPAASQASLVAKVAARAASA
jgi:hypothetical protein